jgi:hypothetical protein
LLEQGHKYGLFNSDTIVFGINEIWVNNPSQYLSPGADPLIIFKGCFGITANAILMLEYTPKGVEFLNKMQHLPSPLVNGVCDNSTDDEGHYYFRNTSGSCFPLDYTALDATSISPIAAVAYDAVYAIALGLNALNTPFNSSLVARQAHYATMINHNLVSFYGASGLVAFMDVSPSPCITFFLSFLLTYYDVICYRDFNLISIRMLSFILIIMVVVIEKTGMCIASSTSTLTRT